MSVSQSRVTPTRAVGRGNDVFRHEWVCGAICAAISPGCRVLDVGCGSQPYRRLIERIGGTYLAHDFAAYDGTHQAGLQDPSWTYGPLDYVGDILEIPEEAFDAVICTEVLEHVPDPVAALRRLSRVTAPRGRIILTVPFMSLMHQAPFWFSSGLSPFWFEYWSPRVDCDLRELTINGDYGDVLIQEARRISTSTLGALSRLKGRPSMHQASVADAPRRTPSPTERRLASLARILLPRDLSESAAFGTYVVLEKL